MTAPLQTKFRQLTHAYWEASNDLSGIVKKLIKSEVKKSLNYITEFVLSIYFNKVKTEKIASSANYYLT